MDAPKEYLNFIGSVKDRIRNTQYAALKAVNKELVGLYWDIGRMISEKQRELGWGKSVVKNISDDLRSEFPDQKGFSEINLWLMVQFYNEYQGDTILQPLAGEISFSHNVIIFTKCKDQSSRCFYISSSKKFGWSKRILEHQIDNKTYEKYLLGQTTYDQEPPEKYDHQKHLAIKDHYTFVGNQYRIEVGGEEFFIDLLLYNRDLQCLIVVELKTGKFTPEYKGKMEFYLNVLNDKYRKPNENEAIGIIICKSKNRLVVEYSLKKIDNSIRIASYSTGPELPLYYEKVLPTLEQIERGLGR